MQTATTKKKYKIEDYISPQRANPLIHNCSHENQALHCVCKSTTPQGLACFRCKEVTHICIINQPNRQTIFECSRCLNRYLDPLYQVKKVLVQSYIKIYSIFTYSHTINFQFNLCHEDLSSIVEIRGIVPGSTSLGWPMQGGFSINDEKSNFHELKPLMINSNRKARREEYFSIPADKLRLGKNFIRFKIPCLDRHKFISSYQHEQKKTYYMSINLVNKLTPKQLQTQTFRERRTQKNQSLQIIKLSNSDIEITQNKLCLVCPYSRDRIKVPIRGRYCQHFSCICLQTLIASHSGSRTWSCPLCDNRINEPYVDVWIYNMLIDNQKGSEVMVKLDGTYEWVKQAEDNALDLDSSQSPYERHAQNSKMEIQMPVQKSLEKIEKKDFVINIEDDDDVQVAEPSNNPAKTEPINKPDNSNEQLQKMAQQALLAYEKEATQQEKKKEVIAKIKQKLNKQDPNTITRNIIGQNIKCQTSLRRNVNDNQTSVRSNSYISSEPKYDKNREDSRNLEGSRNLLSVPSYKKPVLYDIKTLQSRQLKLEEFRRMHSRGKAINYKKYAQVQEIRRLFKQIL